jgi:hypothetical protein
VLTLVTGVDPLLVEWLERAVSRAPRLVQRVTWELRFAGGALELVTTGREVRVDQPACASYGMAVEFLLTALHERGMSGGVTFAPSPDQPVLARIEARPSAAPSKIDRALFMALDIVHAPVLLSLPTTGCEATPYQRDVLDLAAAAHRTRLVWDAPVSPDTRRTAVVTPADTPDDWFRAGRATAHVLLRAHTLGLQTSLVTPSLRHATVRDAVCAWLQPPAYPQVLMQLHQFPAERARQPGTSGRGARGLE